MQSPLCLGVALVGCLKALEAGGSAAVSGSAAPPAAPLGHPVARLRQGWVEFLGRWQWDWFCTFTFDPAKHSSPNGMVHPEKGVKAFRLFVNELNCELYGRNWKRRDEGVHYALALEFHKSGILHLHALVGAERDLNEVALRTAWKEWWYEHFGIARIERPNDSNNVRGYCSKYVAKGGDLLLSENLRFTVRQESLGLSRGRTN